MDFKVKCVRYICDAEQHFTVGRVYDVVDGKLICDTGYEYTAWALNNHCNFESLKEWFADYYDFELVEDKKVFTKKDLKNGDVIVRENGWVEIVIVDLDMLVTKNEGWNNLSCVREDLTDSDSEGDFQYDIVKVYRPCKRWQCCFNANSYTAGELVYDRERDTKPAEPPKPLYNGKVVCIDLNGCNTNEYTVGKIYEFKDGRMTSDSNYTFGENETFYTFEDWANFTSSKFIEIKE